MVLSHSVGQTISNNSNLGSPQFPCIAASNLFIINIWLRGFSLQTQASKTDQHCIPRIIPRNITYLIIICNTRVWGVTNEMDISSSCSLTFSQSARHDHHIMHRRPRSRPAFWQQSILIHRVMPTRFLCESYFLLRKTFIFLSISICLVCGRILTSLEKLRRLIVSVWGLHGGAS